MMMTPMKKIDKRVQKHIQSIYSLRDFLFEVIREPASFSQNQELLKCLKSQGALAKYHDETYGIYPSSINTLKRICEKSFEGGFDALDRLRREAFEAIENEQKKLKKINKITRIGLQQRISELEKTNQVLQQELLLLSYLLEKSMRQARYYAQHTHRDQVRLICEKEQNEIRSFLSLSSTTTLFKDKIKELNNG